MSRETIEASEAALQELLERRLDDKDFLVIYIDGLHCGQHCVIGAVRVDAGGHNRVLGIQEGPENGAACKDLLQNLVERRLDPAVQRLFVIDGSKAPRTTINAVFGAKVAVQTCRHLNAAQCGREVARGITRANALADASGLEARCQGRDGALA